MPIYHLYFIFKYMHFIAEMGFNPKRSTSKDVLYNTSCSFIFTEIKEMS